MTTSDASWSPNLRIVGDLERPDHYYLTNSDECAFFGEYTAGGGWSHSETNQLIYNLKKRPRSALQALWYKSQAIERVAAVIRANLKQELLGRTVIVPIPPSKLASSPEYDDRMIRVARAIGPNADVRPVLFSAKERDPLHAVQAKRDPAALRATLAIDRSLLGKAPEHAVLLDDMLTTGCSFRACKAMLIEAWSGVQVTGIFVARRIIPPPQFEGPDLFSM